MEYGVGYYTPSQKVTVIIIHIHALLLPCYHIYYSTFLKKKEREEQEQVKSADLLLSLYLVKTVEECKWWHTP